MRKLDLKESMRAVVMLSREFPLATLIAVLVVFATAGKGQQQKADEITTSPYSLQVQSRLVVLDVVVTDRAGAIRTTSRRRILTSSKMASSKRLSISRFLPLISSQRRTIPSLRPSILINGLRNHL
jgi:hypothetical protein